ncbi:MAG: DJ-1/PfpI family protein [Pseudomonadota bacterium]
MHVIGALIFPRFELLDLYGPLEMFGMFPDEFQIRIVAAHPDPVASTQGPRTAVDDLIGARDGYDILLVPGGAGTREGVHDRPLLDWIARTAASAEITASICTGSALLAAAGVLDGRAATTNKLAFDKMIPYGPKTDWKRRARWVEDGPVFTASGVSAGTDMSLAVIERLLGPDHAAQAAQWAEYERNSDPDNDPFAVESPS